MRADDWPQWRGPQRDGVWRETGLVDHFAKPQIPLKWRVEIASGYSGPTVADGRVYVTDRIASPKQIERVHCFKEDTGERLWSYEYECAYTVGYDAGPRASVSIDNGRAYALGAMGHFHCFDAATGEVLWKRDLAAEYDIRMPIWGIAASPLIDGDLVTLQIGGRPGACLIALDKVTGKERWRSMDDDASYCAPLLIEQAGRKILLCLTGQHLAGLDPKSGAVFWTIDFLPHKMVIVISTPVVEANRVFVTSFYDGSMMAAFDPDRFAARELWRRKGLDEKKTDALHSIIATPLFILDYIYGVD
ncbi:MAG TPA: PQQ-binding-like beta-propeller repeat protein, partial [Pirellulales bacterium]|nr:PQQ-binding-like beta-propeller repeat protein [Pirellulales bacterium]